MSRQPRFSPICRHASRACSTSRSPIRSRAWAGDAAMKQAAARPSTTAPLRSPAMVAPPFVRPRAPSGPLAILEAVADALGALGDVVGRVLRVALDLVRLALGLGPAVAGDLADRVLDRALDLVRRSRRHGPSPTSWPVLANINLQEERKFPDRKDQHAKGPRQEALRGGLLSGLVRSVVTGRLFEIGSAAVSWGKQGPCSPGSGQVARRSWNPLRYIHTGRLSCRSGPRDRLCSRTNSAPSPDPACPLPSRLPPDPRPTRTPARTRSTPWWPGSRPPSKACSRMACRGPRPR